MKLTHFSYCLYCVFMLQVSVVAWKKPRRIPEGGGINFPRRPLSKAVAEQFIFNKTHYTIYRINNPLFNGSFARDVELVFENLPKGDMNFNWVSRNGKRVFCDGPYEIAFDTFQFPPDRVKWCKAEKDLRRTFGLAFDDEFMRFNPTGDRCPD